MAKENMNPKIFSLNLQGGADTRLALDFYFDLLSGIKVTESEGHSELKLSTGEILVFSKATADCPVIPGTITIQVEPGFQLPESKGWKNLRAPIDKPYSLWEDPFGNWVWVYRNSER